MIIFSKSLPTDWFTHRHPDLWFLVEGSFRGIIVRGAFGGIAPLQSLIIRADEGKAPAVALSARDLRKIIEIIDVIYSVPDNQAMFRAVCEKLQKQIGICSGVFTYADPKTSAYLINGCESFQIAQGALVLYVAHFAQLDPFVKCGYYLGNRINIAARNTDLVSKSSLLRSEFACDFLLSVASVFYVLAAALGSQGDIVAILGFSTARRPSATSPTGTSRSSIWFSRTWQERFTTGI